MKNKDMEEKDKKRYVQSRTNWCWASACKIVAEQYKRKHPEYCFDIADGIDRSHGGVSREELAQGVGTQDMGGINWNLHRGGIVKVDAWQRAIVMNANTVKTGYDGNVAGDDEAKERGIKYCLTGDAGSSIVGVETIGSCDGRESLYDRYRDKICRSLGMEEYLIGNATLSGNGRCHSFVVLAVERDMALLFDTADGEVLVRNVSEVFDSGFDSCLGNGIIRWAQRIKQPEEGGAET